MTARRRAPATSGADPSERRPEASPRGAGRLRRRCQRRLDQLLAEVTLPDPFDVDRLVDVLEQVRGRPIDLHPLTGTAGGVCGMWVRRPDVDVIAYAADTSRLHQDHIILHEIGHMIFAHEGSCHLDRTAVGALLPDLDPGLVRHMLGRSTFTDEREREAELTALLLWRRGRVPPPAALANPGVGGAAAARLARIADAFGA